MSIVKRTYHSWPAELKNNIQQSRLRSALQVNNNMLMPDKVTDAEKWTWYIYTTIDNNRSRNVPHYPVDSGLYERQHKSRKTHKFHVTLPAAPGG